MSGSFSKYFQENIFHFLENLMLDQFILFPSYNREQRTVINNVMWNMAFLSNNFSAKINKKYYFTNISNITFLQSPSRVGPCWVGAACQYFRVSVVQSAADNVINFTWPGNWQAASKELRGILSIKKKNRCKDFSLSYIAKNNKKWLYQCRILVS